jgi:phosphoglycolate phosphatase
MLPPPPCPLTLPGIEAAIVDLDGTLVDTLGDFTAALNATLADLSLPLVERGRVEPMVGKGSEHLLRTVLRSVLAASPELFQETRLQARIDSLYPMAWARYQAHYLAINGRFSEVYPGAVAGLQMLKSRGLRLACLTNKPIGFARPLLKAKGLDAFFDLVFGGDSFERKKPDPLPLLKTCEALQIEPRYTLMIGDSSNDAQAARSAGCPVALVRFGYNHGEPIDEVDCDVLLDSLANLGASLKV